MKALVAVIVLAVVGLGVWMTAGGASAGFGVDAANPVGDAAQIGAYFKSKGMKRHPVEMELLHRLFGLELARAEGLVGVEYREPIAGYRHYAAVVTDPSGKVVAVGAEFRSGSFTFSTVGSKSETFAGRFWKSLVGAEPELAKKSSATEDFIWAEATRGKARATWRKTSATGEIKMSHEMVDRVAFVAR